MPQTTLPDGTPLPVLGLGTWRLGEDAGARRDEIRTLHAAIAMGYRLIDTAEMYGEGGAEQVVGQAVADAIRAGDVDRRSLYVVEDIAAGDALTRSNVRAIRPGLGLPPKFLDTVLGRTARTMLKRGAPLSWNDLG